MSPASYLTAPPRDAASIVADRSGSCEQPGSGSAGSYLRLCPAPKRSCKPETEAEHGHPGDGVEHEVVARDDDREHDERRVDHAGGTNPHRFSALLLPLKDRRGVEQSGSSPGS